MELSIIKIIDGVFISNSLVLEDPEFLFSNKVSHIVTWTKDFPEKHRIIKDFQEQGIKFLVFEDPSRETPCFQHLKKSTAALMDSREQYLCSLLFADQTVDVLPFLVAYLVSRFRWTRDTALSFLQKRLSLQNVDELFQKIDKLYDFDEGLNMFEDQLMGLKTVQWNMTFLRDYHTDDPEEAVVINTMKNTLPKGNNDLKCEKKQKKTKRVHWSDTMARNSINAGKRLFLNSGISNSLKKTTLGSIQAIGAAFTQKPLLKQANQSLMPVCLNSSLQGRATSAKKSNRVQKGHNKEGEKEFQDFDYLSLKQLSRTNFDDLRMKGSKLRKRQSLTIKMQQQSTGNIKKKNIALSKQTKQTSNKIIGHQNLFKRSWKNFQLLQKQF